MRSLRSLLKPALILAALYSLFALIMTLLAGWWEFLFKETVFGLTLFGIVLFTFIVIGLAFLIISQHKGIKWPVDWLSKSAAISFFSSAFEGDNGGSKTHRVVQIAVTWLLSIIFFFVMVICLGLLHQTVLKPVQFHISENTPNAALCALSGEHRQNCVTRIGRMRLDPEICTLFWEDTPEFCIPERLHPVFLTKSFGETVERTIPCKIDIVYDCVLEVAKLQKNGSVCDQFLRVIPAGDHFRPMQWAEFLRDACYVEYSAAAADLRICLMAPVEEEHKCLPTIAKKSNNATICLKGRSDYGRYMCLLGQAILQKDQNNCLVIGNQTYEKSCLRESVAVQDNVSLCDLYSYNITDRLDCIAEFASYHENVSICFLSGEILRECISSIDSDKLVVVNCSEMPTPSMKDDCKFYNRYYAKRNAS
jgi:hypothetical protein